jgi:hypothetical protein
MPELSNETIIVPMNPRGSYLGGSTAGSIIAVKWFSDQKGRVVISFDNRCKYTNSPERPRVGFFYDTGECDRKVTHRFSIFDITDDDGVKKYERFVPPWRLELFEKTRERSKRRTWLLIGEIYNLDTPKDLKYFTKSRAQSFVYSDRGSELTYAKESTTPDEFIDDIIFHRAISETDKFTEDDLELIVWALIVKNGNARYLERQRVYQARGRRLRIDMVVKDSKGQIVVIELKRDKADSDTLNKQLRPYMKQVMKRYPSTKVRGIIVARDASKDLRAELSKQKNAGIKFVPYRFTFNSNRIEEALFL